MALPLPPSLTPAEMAFLCEMEMVTIMPRQRLDSLELLSGTTSKLQPPQQANIPLWLALLLKQQRRASIIPPPWLSSSALQDALDKELNGDHHDLFSESTRLEPIQNPAIPPFQPSSTAGASSKALPYYWQEIGQTLLVRAGDDIADAEQVRRLLRDLREVRMAKVRAKVNKLQAGAGVEMTGIGSMEIGESRLFISGVIDGLRKIGASREAANREKEEEEEEARGAGFGMGGLDEDDDML